MLIMKLRLRVEQSNISLADTDKLMAALKRIEVAAFTATGKLKIAKEILCTLVANFSAELNKAILAWGELEVQYKTFQPRIRAVMTKINIKLIYISESMSSDMHMVVLKAKAKVRQAYSMVTDAMRTSKSISNAVAYMALLEEALAKFKL